MRDTARVIKIESAKVWVIPILTDTCMNCHETSCAKQGEPFAVSNTRKLPVNVGATVKIAASPKQQALQALAAIGLPVCAAAAGYYVPYAFTARPPEYAQICAVLGAFLLTSLAVLLLNRRHSAKKMAEITEIVTNMGNSAVENQ